MMSYPDIHTCMRLTAENEELKLKLIKLKHQRDDAVKELREIKEANKVHELLRNYVTTRDIHVQTDPKLAYPGLHSAAQRKKKIEDQNAEDKKSSTLLSMHSSLMKRYEKEVKQNMTHIETITNLNLGMIELEKKLKERTEELTTMERELKMLQIQSKSKARLKHMHGSRSPEDDSEEEDILKLRKENKKLKKDLGKLKQELSGLDHGFFEEIEDIKYALQQAAKLNKVYEKTLRKMCMQFGVPYPNPEKTMGCGR